MNDLIKIRREILTYVRKNQEKKKANSYYIDMLTKAVKNKEDIPSFKFASDPMEKIIDIR